jgi:tetratricopeptide (TPR) repeat protein
MASERRPVVTLVPLLGPLHVRMPQYNAVSVLRSVQSFEPEALALVPLTPGALGDPAWQDCAETVLPHTVVPWARRTGLMLAEVGAPIQDTAAEDDFHRYLAGFEGGKHLLASIAASEAPVRDIVGRALDLDGVLDELLPAIRVFQQRRAEAFGEGPGTGWQQARAAHAADAVVALGAGRVVVLAGVDDVPSLNDALEAHVTLLRAPTPVADEAVRRRSLLDYAMRADAAEPGAVIERLADIDAPEARYLEANLLVQAGDPEAALAVLEAASTQDFVEPYYLPGFLLSRLGQLYDLAGRRDAALRAYRGVRALSYAPPEALAAAEAGLAQPFTLSAAPLAGAGGR